MDQTVLGQHAHRVGFTLGKRSFCDGCNHEFGNGEMAFRCLECSGFVCPGSSERNVRQTQVTTNVSVKYGATKSDKIDTESFTGYDLCLDCAKKPHLHSHHHFTLAICRI
jgi:hypothetical protein